MLRLFLSLLLIIACACQAVTPTQPFDKQLALAVGRAYVESYVRWHPDAPQSFDWSKEGVEFLEHRTKEVVGYVAVYVPATSGDEGGMVYFEVRDLDPGHMIVTEWGCFGNLNKELERFRWAVSSGLYKPG